MVRVFLTEVCCLWAIGLWYNIGNKDSKGMIARMPTISMFYGIIIRMFCAPEEHNPPHFRAYYGEYKAIIDINTCELTGGNLPKNS